MRGIFKRVLIISIIGMCVFFYALSYGETAGGQVTFDSAQSLTIRFTNGFGLRMSPLSVNKTLHFSELFYTDDKGVKIKYHPISTDWIGPLMVRATGEEVTRDDEVPRFTGGFHGSDGDEGGEATSKTVRMSITVDGKSYETFELKKKVAFETISIVLVKHTNAYNAADAPVVEETVSYEISADGTVKVAVKLTALSDLVIEKYYGLQSRTLKSTTIIKMEGLDHKAKSYFESQNARAWGMDVFGKYWIEVALEDTGLGDFSYCIGKPQAFNLSYGKTYFNLINGRECVLGKGESVGWSGRYSFKGQYRVDAPVKVESGGNRVENPIVSNEAK